MLLWVFECEVDDGERLGAIDPGGRVDVAVGDEAEEVVGELRRDGYVEVGDDDLDAVLVGAVQVLVDVLLAHEVSVLA